MLQATYIHAPGIGPTTEQSLWRQGATSWDDFLALENGLKLPARHREELRATVEDSRAALQTRDVNYFARNLPRREQWRTVGNFSRWGFLDIETDGGTSPGSVTVIGLYDGDEMRVFLKGDNLNHFPCEAESFDGFVTFFGSGFDLPMLSRRFPSLWEFFASRLHVDLCPALRRLGHKGGLKSVEQQIGLHRGQDTSGLDGCDAVHLWAKYQRGGAGGDRALETLLAYNRDDCVNMKTLLEYAVPKLREVAGWRESD